MPIRNKDGTVFKLNGVNPLMKDQDHWKGEKWVVYPPDDPQVIILPDPKRNFSHVDEGETFVPSILGVGPIQQKEILYCAPLVVSYEEDPVYGHKKRKTDWGEKFSFEAVVITASTGLTATYFAKVPANRVPEGSIILVYNERQWWKVNTVENINDGINIHCVPTDLKPSFGV